MNILTLLVLLVSLSSQADFQSLYAPFTDTEWIVQDGSESYCSFDTGDRVRIVLDQINGDDRLVWQKQYPGGWDRFFGQDPILFAQDLRTRAMSTTILMDRWQESEFRGDFILNTGYTVYHRRIPGTEIRVYEISREISVTRIDLNQNGEALVLTKLYSNTNSEHPMTDELTQDCHFTRAE